MSPLRGPATVNKRGQIRPIKTWEGPGPPPPDQRRWVARVYWRDGMPPAVSPSASWFYLKFWWAAVRRAHGDAVRCVIIAPDPRDEPATGAAEPDD